ncbi:FGGY-family carbohydrate kinase [Vibrio sp. PP-XX7]
MTWPRSVEHNNGVYFVPALAGLGAPYWDAKARGMICGLTDSATPAILARAAFESVVYQIADLFFAIEAASGHSLTQLLVDGGPTKNRSLMQLQADLLQVPIVQQRYYRSLRIRAAYLAGKASRLVDKLSTIMRLCPRLTEAIELQPSFTTHTE